MQTPLIEPLINTGDHELINLIAFFNETLRFCPNSVLTMQRRPEIAKAFINLNKAVMENHETISTEMRKYWDDGEIVEILGVISLFGYLNRWNDSVGTTLEPGAVESGKKWLSPSGWMTGKHG